MRGFRTASRTFWTSLARGVVAHVDGAREAATLLVHRLCFDFYEVKWEHSDCLLAGRSICSNTTPRHNRGEKTLHLHTSVSTALVIFMLNSLEPSPSCSDKEPSPRVVVPFPQKLQTDLPWHLQQPPAIGESHCCIMIPSCTSAGHSIAETGELPLRNAHGRSGYLRHLLILEAAHWTALAVERTLLRKVENWHEA